VLITAEMVRAMRPGPVIVDLAAEQGGNCELTKACERVSGGGVAILGPVNLVSEMALQASQLYARNVLSLLLHLYTGRRGGSPSTPPTRSSRAV